MRRREDAEEAGRKKAAARGKGPGRKALLLGLGLDGKDGHLRLTKGPNFQLIGGAEETHAGMQEKAVKFNEELAKKGKRLEELRPEEFVDLAHKAKFHEK